LFNEQNWEGQDKVVQGLSHELIIIRSIAARTELWILSCCGTLWL